MAREQLNIAATAASEGSSAFAQSLRSDAASAKSVSRFSVWVLRSWDLDVLIVVYLVAKLALETLPTWREVSSVCIYLSQPVSL